MQVAVSGGTLAAVTAIQVSCFYSVRYNNDVNLSVQGKGKLCRQYKFKSRFYFCVEYTLSSDIFTVSLFLLKYCFNAY